MLKCLSDYNEVQGEFTILMDKIDKLDFNNLPKTAHFFADLFTVMTHSILQIDFCTPDGSEYDMIFRKIYHLLYSTIVKRLMLNFITNPQQIFKSIQDAADNYLKTVYVSSLKSSGY